MSQEQPPMPSKGPYPATTAGVGGLPTNSTDVPVCAVFLFLYICFAATNMTIFQINRRKGYKFIPSAMLFGFCMARIVTLTLRIVWANRPHSVQIAIAAQIFVNAGILIVYIVNLLFSQRILRAKQPHIGWNFILRTLYKVLYALVIGALIMVITATIVSIYTLDKHIRQQCRDIQITAITFLLVITILPLFALAAAHFLPRHAQEEHFGQRSIKTKSTVVLVSTLLCIIIAGFKTGTVWETPRPRNDPAWYDSKAAFYVFNFSMEILILCLLTFTRPDRLFHVPNGCKGPGDYTRLRESALKHEHESSRVASFDEPKSETQV